MSSTRSGFDTMLAARSIVVVALLLLYCPTGWAVLDSQIAADLNFFHGMIGFDSSVVPSANVGCPCNTPTDCYAGFFPTLAYECDVALGLITSITIDDAETLRLYRYQTGGNPGSFSGSGWGTLQRALRNLTVVRMQVAPGSGLPLLDAASNLTRLTLQDIWVRM